MPLYLPIQWLNPSQLAIRPLSKSWGTNGVQANPRLLLVKYILPSVSLLKLFRRVKGMLDRHGWSTHVFGLWRTTSKRYAAVSYSHHAFGDCFLSLAVIFEVHRFIRTLDMLC